MGTLALAGDTMLGRGVAEHLATHPMRTLFGDELLEILAAADGMLLNLECCVSDRGEPWPGRLFHFRAPPLAVDALTLLGVRCVTLANNHALDFGEQALLDTLEHLRAAGIAVAGAGESRQVARAPARISIGDREIMVVSFSDHPAEYAATPPPRGRIRRPPRPSPRLADRDAAAALGSGHAAAGLPPLGTQHDPATPGLHPAGGIRAAHRRRHLDRRTFRARLPGRR